MMFNKTILVEIFCCMYFCALALNFEIQNDVKFGRVQLFPQFLYEAKVTSRSEISCVVCSPFPVSSGLTDAIFQG